MREKAKEEERMMMTRESEKQEQQLRISRNVMEKRRSMRRRGSRTPGDEAMSPGGPSPSPTTSPHPRTTSTVAGTVGGSTPAITLPPATPADGSLVLP
eukprot:gene31587-28028_t